MKTIVASIFLLLMFAINVEGQSINEVKRLINHSAMVLDSLNYKEIVIEGKWVLAFKQEGKFPKRSITKLGNNTRMFFSSDTCFFEQINSGKVTPFGRFEFYEDNYLVLIPDDQEKTYYNILYLEKGKYLVVELHVLDEKKAYRLKNTNRKLLYVNESYLN